MNENFDKIGEVADTLDNLIAAMSLPIPPEIHLKALKESLPEASKKLKEAYIAETGGDPWDTNF